MKNIERERVFLLKELPSNISEYKMLQIKVGDFYDSNSTDALKIRQKGANFHLIKKVTNTTHERVEHVIDIKEGEFDVIFKCCVQSHEKNRYTYSTDSCEYEIDYYLGRLDGYARVEVEFDNDEDMSKFTAPEWFGEEITDINHEIHENLGIVSFNDMKERYSQRGIDLKMINNIS